MPKTRYKKVLRGGLRACNINQSLRLEFLGLRKIVACSQFSLQCLLVSTVFGIVSSLHTTSVLDFYTCLTRSRKAYSPHVIQVSK